MTVDPATIRTAAMFVDGAWSAAGSGATFEATSPASGTVIARIPKGGREDVRRAVAAALAAQPL